MTTAVSTLLGRPVWYELMTTDMSAAQAFYQKVLGWSSTPFDDASHPYSVFKRSGDAQVAGVMNRPAGMRVPPFWAMYVAVPNFEEAQAHVKKLGGSEMSPVIEISTVGRLQMVKDPQGAAFYIIQPASREERPEKAPDVGDASWHELLTTDVPAAMKFYRELFGWQPGQTHDMGEMGVYQMFDRPHGMIGGMMKKPAAMANVPPHWMIYFLVDDIDKAVERVTVNGGKVLNGPMEVPGGSWIVNAMDPQGAGFSLHERKSA